MSIGDKVRATRKAVGISQEEVARRAGVSLNVINRLERGVILDPHFSTLRGIASALGVPVEDLVREPAPAGKTEAPDTGLTALSPDELETRVFGAPVRVGEEPKPVIDAEDADELARKIRAERDALERWLEEYAAAPSPVRFAGRASAEEIEKRALWAQVYRLFLIDVWSKLADPRHVPFKSVWELAVLADETFYALRDRVEERDNARRTEDRAG